MIETLLSDAPKIAFTDGIGSWGMIGRFENLDATCLRQPSKARPELAVVITNQIPGCLPIGGRFPKLLRHPSIGRGSRNANVKHLARFQFDKKESEERSKE